MPTGDLNDIAASYIRIASVSIAAYDYILTVPAAWRFYRGQRLWKFSPGCILFMLIRYVSIVTISVSTIGYFGTFTPEVCQRYYIVAPVFKVLQTMVSQLIMGIRTVNIARRQTWVVWTLFVVFTVATALQWFTNLYHRSFAQDSSENCTASSDVSGMSVWLYYVVSMVYDFFIIGISTFYLLSFGPSATKMSQLVRVMFFDGIIYFVVVTVANIFNLILYRTSDKNTQSSGASLCYAVTWIMTQRVLIHLRDAAEEHNRATEVTTHAISSPHAISRAMRSQFDTKDVLDTEFAFSRHSQGPDSRSVSDIARGQLELDVHVQVEESVTVEYDPELALQFAQYRNRRRWPRPGTWLGSSKDLEHEPAQSC